MLCPHCQTFLTDAPDLAGQEVACPMCSGHFFMSGAVEPPLPVAKQVERRPQERRKESPALPQFFKFGLAGVTVIWLGVVVYDLIEFSAGGSGIESNFILYSPITTHTFVYFAVAVGCSVGWLLSRD